MKSLSKFAYYLNLVGSKFEAINVIIFPPQVCQVLEWLTEARCLPHYIIYSLFVYAV